MNVPVEMVIFLLGGNGALLTVVAHVLLSILRGNSSMDKRIALVEYKLGFAPKPSIED